MIDRMIRAARLDASLYEEVEHRPELNQEAMIVVAIVSLLVGIGGFISSIFTGEIGSGVIVLIFQVVFSLIGWAIWSAVAYFVGTRIFGGTATLGEVLRAVGFAYTPNVLGLVQFIPCLGGILWLVGAIWSLIAVVIALRQSLDVSTGAAVMTVIILFVIQLILFGIMFSILLALGIGASVLGGGVPAQ